MVEARLEPLGWGARMRVVANLLRDVGVARTEAGATIPKFRPATEQFSVGRPLSVPRTTLISNALTPHDCPLVLTRVPDACAEVGKAGRRFVSGMVYPVVGECRLSNQVLFEFDLTQPR